MNSCQPHVILSTSARVSEIVRWRYLMEKLRWPIILLMGLIFGIACGDGGGGDGNGSNDNNTGSTNENLIVIGLGVSFSCTDAYSPAERTVSVGTTVTWRNDDNTRHTVTSSDGVICTNIDALPVAERTLDSGDIFPGETFDHTFDTAGIYHYICSILGHMMQGTITVTEN